MAIDNPAPTAAERDATRTAESQAHEGSVGGFVNAELSLLGSLKQNLPQAFTENLKENWPTLAIEAGVGLVTGAALAAITKNPALVGRTIGQVLRHENPLALGEWMAPAVAKTAAASPYIFGAAAAYDVGDRLGSPAWDLMLHPENRTSLEQKFASNVSGVVQDFTVMGVGGYAGARFAFGRTAPFVNRGPEVDFTGRNQWAAESPEKLNKGARVQNPQDYVFAEEKSVAPDVEQHYNSAFPAEERQAVEGEGGYNEKIAQGANMVYTLRNKATGELAAAHILGVHDQPDPSPASQGMMRDFGNWLTNRQPEQLRTMHGDFIFVRDDLRSQGVGSHMYDLVDKAIQTQARDAGKHLTALTGEMEDPKEPAVKLLDLVSKTDDRTPSASQSTDPIRDAQKLLANARRQYPEGIQDVDPEHLGVMVMEGLREPASLSTPLSANPSRLNMAALSFALERGEYSTEAREIGEALQMLDERTRRQAFYWALPNPKVDSGVTWKIQDFNDPDYRGAAHWTSVVYDPAKFAPREAGYNFMVDEAGYTLDPNSPQVREYMRDNNYYRGSATPAYTAGSLLGSLADPARKTYRWLSGS